MNAEIFSVGFAKRFYYICRGHVYFLVYFKRIVDIQFLPLEQARPHRVSDLEGWVQPTRRSQTLSRRSQSKGKLIHKMAKINPCKQTQLSVARSMLLEMYSQATVWQVEPSSI